MKLILCGQDMLDMRHFNKIQSLKIKFEKTQKIQSSYISAQLVKDSDMKMGRDDGSWCKMNVKKGLLIGLRESESPLRSAF